MDLSKKWHDMALPIINRIKVHLLRQYSADILVHFKPKIEYLLKKYIRALPMHVADSESDDLRTIAQLEFYETVKSWDPRRNADVWPLAYSRINGAMKDHIRYITRSDPGRFYDWITDAAYLYLTVNNRADFSKRIESGIDLKYLMEELTPRERLIITTHSMDDKTFAQIGTEIGVSESQVSRIYKAALDKVRQKLAKDEKREKLL